MPSCNARHSYQNTDDGIHIPYAFEYTNSTARTSDTGFITADVGKFARQTDDNSIWMLTSITPTWSSVSGIGITNHKNLYHLIHFIDNGPADGFASGAYRETTGTVFPSSIIWYDQIGSGKKKIVSKEITYLGPFPTLIVWKMYDSLETLVATVSDNITYSGPFEISRIRTIT